MRRSRKVSPSSKPSLKRSSGGSSIDHPAHYNKSRIETIDHIEDIVQFYQGREAFNVGQVIKYLARAPHKNDLVGDLKKAQWYMNNLLAGK